MKFTPTAVLAFVALGGSSDAFFSQSFIRSGGVSTQNQDVTKQKTTGIVSMADDGFSDDFLQALSPGKKSKGDDDNDDTNVDEDVESGSSRFKDLLKAAEQNRPTGTLSMPHAIENPFLNPPLSTSSMSSQPIASDPNELSVEEQARMFREMMAQQQGGTAAVAPQTPVASPQRVAKTDRAGRPVGRNQDADTIANAADLYFAQLKRDSTVRTLARIRGEDDVAEGVFEDEGIRQLDELLQKNPYLQGQREKDMELIDEIPDEALAPYFETDGPREEEMTISGPSYRKKLMERRQRQSSGGERDGLQKDVITKPSQSSAGTANQITSEIAQFKDEPTLQDEPTLPETIVAENAIHANQMSLPISETVVIESSSSETLRSPAADPQGSRQNMRTLMGLLLKHRGGPGFGKGRLKGPEIDRFDDLLKDVSSLLREESNSTHRVDAPLTSVAPSSPLYGVTTQSPPVPTTAFASAPVPDSGGVSSTGMDSTIACIEGAITMYKNCPPDLQKSVLVTLRAALESALDTCDTILADHPSPPITGSTEGNINNTIAVIEGAITMYKNSPPGLKHSVLVMLRAALISAVSTCSSAVGAEQQPSSTLTPQDSVDQPTSPFAASPTETDSVVSPEAVVTCTTNDPKSSPASGADANTKKLAEIYDRVKAASGAGKLGLCQDLNPIEANELAEQLVEMRMLLMEELESGIPDAEPVSESSMGHESPAASKYQQMLAKARAEKAAG